MYLLNVKTFWSYFCYLYSFLFCQISSALTPCADFFLRSKSHGTTEDSIPNKVDRKSGDKNFSDLNCAIQLGMTLIILWKVGLVLSLVLSPCGLSSHYFY